MAYQPYNSVKQNLRGYQSPSGLPVRTKPLAQRCARAAILVAIRRFVLRTAAHLACLSLLVPDVSAEKAAGARIVAIADTLDAIIYDRAYRPAQDLKAARTEIKS